MGSGREWWADQEEAYAELREELGVEAKYTPSGSIDLDHLEELRARARARPPLTPVGAQVYRRLDNQKDRVKRIYRALSGEPLLWHKVRDHPEAFVISLRTAINAAVVKAHDNVGRTRVHRDRIVGPPHDPSRTLEEVLAQWNARYAAAIMQARKAEKERDVVLALADEVDELLKGVEVRPEPIGIG